MNEPTGIALVRDGRTFDDEHGKVYHRSVEIVVAGRFWAAPMSPPETTITTVCGRSFKVGGFMPDDAEGYEFCSTVGRSICEDCSRIAPSMPLSSKGEAKPDSAWARALARART